ncbi:MAG: tripartite tricarboxylate transporter substrate binding protein [Alphaproteobacteria bacterium]|nr:tripartite tricarboxylate transporter substrate binding protein [Alphaproteobacteria bacterium]
MSTTRRRFVAGSSALAALPLAAGLAPKAAAQATWPTQPITLVVPYAAGGGADIVARELAQLLSPKLGQPLVVDNKGGAAGGIGTHFVARARSDGYTVLYAVGTNIVLNPHILKNFTISTLDDLVPVVQTTDYQYVLAVHPDVPAKTAMELAALARKEPGKLTFSSSGVGGNNHLCGVLFAHAAGVELTHVPYKGTGPALLDVINGVITMNFSSLPPAVAQIKAGKLRALAVTGSRRVKSLPDVPTLEEAGFKGLVVKGWHGLFVPAKTPAEIVDRLEKETKAALGDPKMENALAKDGLEMPPTQSRAQFAEAVRNEHAFWATKLKELNLKFE